MEKIQNNNFFKFDKKWNELTQEQKTFLSLTQNENEAKYYWNNLFRFETPKKNDTSQLKIFFLNFVELLKIVKIILVIGVTGFIISLPYWTGVGAKKLIQYYEWQNWFFKNAIEINTISGLWCIGLFFILSSFALGVVLIFIFLFIGMAIEKIINF
jgi:hypothetical protein